MSKAKVGVGSVVRYGIRDSIHLRHEVHDIRVEGGMAGFCEGQNWKRPE